MSDLLGLLAVFIGGALPWLEAVVVIPIAIVAGLDPLPVLVAAVIGNLATVWVAVVAGERIQAWWRRRRRRTRAQDPPARSARADRIVRRWGLPGLAVVGPIGLGTQLSAVVAIAVGIDRRTTLCWIGGATVAWSLVATALTLAGVSVAGVGA